VTTQSAAADIRLAATLLREAQAVRRRLEKLATLATDRHRLARSDPAKEDPS
jgi:hypothetical protein